MVIVGLHELGVRKRFETVRDVMQDLSVTEEGKASNRTGEGLKIWEEWQEGIKGGACMFFFSVCDIGDPNPRNPRNEPLVSFFFLLEDARGTTRKIATAQA
jgi:hypothetical protein